MRARLPRWTAKQLIRVLKKHGFEERDQSGSHLHLFNPVTNKRTTVPVHSGQIIGPGLMKAILAQADILEDDLCQ